MPHTALRHLKGMTCRVKLCLEGLDDSLALEDESGLLRE